MNRALLTPISLILLWLLSACSSSPSAACITADKYINEQKDALKQIPLRMTAVEEDRSRMLLALLEYCETNPAKFLNNPENYKFTKTRASDCSNWHSFAIFDKKFYISSDIAEIEVQRGRINTRLQTELQINAECFNEDGYLK
jgi:hypothetical protein